MNETQELLKASVERLEGLIGEVKDLRFKIKDVQGDIDCLRSSMKADGQGDAEQQKDARDQGGHDQQQGRQKGCGGRGGEGDDQLSQIEDRLDYLTAKWMELDQEIFKLRKRMNPHS